MGQHAVIEEGPRRDFIEPHDPDPRDATPMTRINLRAP
jgi:hypothetical protein